MNGGFLHRKGMDLKQFAEEAAAIHLRGVRQHNLKNLNLDIPLYHLIAISGVSGSGKSSLALHTLYAEGQRRYVETFSPYARQFLERMDRPDADAIEGIPPSIAIESAVTVRSSRSTVGTMTEITDHLKYLYALIAVPHCSQCGDPIRQEDPESVLERLKDLPATARVLVAFPYRPTGKKWVQDLVSQGFLRVYISNTVLDLETLSRKEIAEAFDKEILVVVDRLPWAKAEPPRVLDSLRTAFLMGHGEAAVVVMEGETFRFSQDLKCARCGVGVEPPSPNLFSFNSPLGACPHCRGFGRIIDVDLDLVIPDQKLSLKQGAIRPWTPDRMEYEELLDFCRKENIPVHVPFRDLSEEDRRKIIEGHKDWYGIRGFFQWLESKTYKMHVRVFLSRYRAYVSCSLCGGSRYRDAARVYRLHGVSIDELCAWSVKRCLAFFRDLAETYPKESAPALLVSEIRHRLQFLSDVGLDYLTLDRQSRTLSGGEVQRVHLTRALGSALTHVLYVLDEPSVGLHARDQERLMGPLRRLVALGNTVIFVEHDPDMLRKADMVIDMGPGGGDQGGEILYMGPPQGLAHVPQSLTGRYLQAAEGFSDPGGKRRPVSRSGKSITVKGATENNLKNLTVSFPLGCLIGVSGVSGSGKSTLVETVLYNGWRRLRGLPGEPAGRFESMKGIHAVSDMILVDQKPVGRSPRANLLNYTKVLDPLRKLFAATPEARLRGYGEGHFSFNVPGGRCDQCKGEGFLKVEMQFLADVYVRCPACDGRRFRGEVLDVRLRGLSIADVLEKTARELLEVFDDVDSVRKALEPVTAIGLDYLRLGQPLTMLSGGEAQRVKLLRYLSGHEPVSKNKGIFFILDEPTVGLHPHDLQKLITILHQLVEKGHTVLVVEHNLELLSACDWIIDLGPEGGDDGGRLVVCGTPEQVATHEGSYTGRYLRERGFVRGDLITSRTENEDYLPISKPQLVDKPNHIIVRGAREHNLKVQELQLPLNRMTVLTGLSGSGKSSLAFDILFAEGQRRYLECLSTFVRQYFKILEKPDVDQILGLPPTVAIEQRTSQLGRKSTVGTITEIYHFLRLAFARLGHQHCVACGLPLQAMNPETIVHRVETVLKERQGLLLAPLVRGRKGIYKDLFLRLRTMGFKKVRIDGVVQPLAPFLPTIARHREHDIEVVVLDTEAGFRSSEGSWQSLIQQALRLGGGTVIVSSAEDFFFSQHLMCPKCEKSYAPLDPRLFSFNSRHGMCLRCDGSGLDGERPCPECHGSRLNAQARAVRLKGFSITELADLPLGAFQNTWNNLSFEGIERPVADPVSREMNERIGFLMNVGLDYLTLNRSGETLSGGEAQRIRLAAQLGSNLRGVCYILDEPTIGLHPADNHKLLENLRRLTDKGNTVLVVEHDEDTMRAADHVVELGPEAGSGGGRVVAQGRFQDLVQRPETLTGTWFGKSSFSWISAPKRSIPGSDGWLVLRGAHANNLKNIDVRIPLGTFVCVTGVSGSGKSSLVYDVLKEALKAVRNTGRLSEKIPLNSLEGHEAVRRLVEVDHTPIGRTPRSTPATYVGIWDEIRKLFAAVPESRARGFRPGRFSFNVKGGRCEVCQGQGRTRVAMSFLPDVTVPCEACGGRRFNRETLGIVYRGITIADVLQMTIAEARRFFASVPSIVRPLVVLDELGLGYLTLGQPSPTLSGGEAQRIKLAAELSNHRAHTLYLLDEPTTGLHRADIGKLLGVLRALSHQGHTLVVIEHNLDVVAACDYVVDLGPGSGDRGGRVVFSGTPEEMVQGAHGSATAKALRRHMNKAQEMSAVES